MMHLSRFVNVGLLDAPVSRRSNIFITAYWFKMPTLNQQANALCYYM